MMTYHFATYCVLLFKTLLTSTNAEIPIHVISGVRFTEMPTVIPYHSTTQLLYKFPFHTKSSFKLPTSTLQKATCKNSLTNPDMFCTNQNYLQQIQNEINIIFNTNELNLNPKLKLNFYNTSSRSKRAINFIGDALEWCCNTATMTNLQDLSKNEQQVDDKMNDLLDYVKEEHADLTLSEAKMNNFTSNINHVLEQLHTSLQKYEINLKEDINVTSSTIEKKLLHNSLEIMSYIYLATHYNTLKKVEEDCQHNFIPEDLVNAQILQNDLEKLSTKLTPSNLTIALPSSKLFQLYSLPISKCYFEQDNIILQIKIPLIPTNTSYTAYSYLPIPLKWENHICNLIDYNFIVFKSSSDLIYIVDSENNPHCNHRTSNLCLIPRYTSISSAASRCAKYLINGTNIAELKHHCEFHCTPAPQHPIVTQLKVNKFLITNYDKNLQITCNSNPLATSLPEILFGAVEIELPCDCKLHDASQTLISTITPCDSRDFISPSVFHLVPLPWTNLDHLKIDPFDTDRTEFLNISNYLLPTWNISVPTFSSSKLQKVTLFKHINLANSWTDIIDDRRIMLYVLLVWCFILTILLVFAIYKIHILTIKQNLLPPQLPPRIRPARSAASVQNSEF